MAESKKTPAQKLEDTLSKLALVPPDKRVVRVRVFELIGNLYGQRIGLRQGDIALTTDKRLGEMSARNVVVIDEPHMDCSLRELRALADKAVPEL